MNRVKYRLAWLLRGILSLFFLFPAQARTIQLVFTGDFNPVVHFQRHVRHHYAYPFLKIPWFSRADLTIVNLEAALTTADSARDKPFTFKAPPEYVNFLKQGGIDLVCLANNHIYDYGAPGLEQTLAVLDNAGIYHVGAGRNEQEARQPVVVSIDSLRFGFLAYYGLRAHEESHPAGPAEAGTALRKLTYIKQDLAALRGQADFKVVILHWGLEKQHFPQQDQIEFAHRVIDFGADLVVGHHPHVLQGVERYKQGVIVYSLGNFIFGGNARTYEETAVLRVTVPSDHPQDWTIEMVPLAVRYWQPYRLQGARADSVRQRLRDYSKIFDRSPLLK